MRCRFVWEVSSVFIRCGDEWMLKVLNVNFVFFFVRNCFSVLNFEVWFIVRMSGVLVRIVIRVNLFCIVLLVV